MLADQAAAFGHRLRELRERAGLTQTQLAERAGLHRQGIVKLERGEREPAWSTLLALAEALGVDLNSFAEPPETPVTARGPGRPPKPATPATPPAEDLQRQAKPGREGAAPKRARAKPPRGTGGRK